MQEHDGAGASSINKLQTVYCFEDGIVGRTGRNLETLPVIEHGFWSDGMRRGVVIVYNTTTLCLDRICFLQQAKQCDDGAPFEVSATNMKHCSVLQKSSQPPHVLTTEEQEAIRSDWSKSMVRRRTKELDK